MLNNIKNIIKAIREGNNFIVTSHYSPDGDNIGSTLSMYYTLKKLGKKVYYVLDDSIPLNLTFLVKDVKILKSEEMNENLNDYTLISLDCGDFNRICVSESIKKSVKQLISTEHHD